MRWRTDIERQRLRKTLTEARRKLEEALSLTLSRRGAEAGKRDAGQQGPR